MWRSPLYAWLYFYHNFLSVPYKETDPESRGAFPKVGYANCLHHPPPSFINFDNRKEQALPIWGGLVDTAAAGSSTVIQRAYGVVGQSTNTVIVLHRQAHHHNCHCSVLLGGRARSTFQADMSKRWHILLSVSRAGCKSGEHAFARHLHRIPLLHVLGADATREGAVKTRYMGRKMGVF